MGQISDLVNEAYEIAKDHGFWDFPYTERNIRNPLAIPTKLSLIIGECIEALELHHKQDKLAAQGIEWRDKFTEEMADIFIRWSDLAGFMAIPIEQAILDKMEVNRGRPHKHGNNY